MGVFSWLRPGNDRQLAADYAAQRRQSHRRSIRKAAAAGQAWEDRDRAQDRKGPWYHSAR